MKAIKSKTEERIIDILGHKSRLTTREISNIIHEHEYEAYVDSTVKIALQRLFKKKYIKKIEGFPLRWELKK